MVDIFELLAGMADGVFAVDGEQRISLWNRAAEELLGVTAQEVLGRSCYEVIQGRDERGCLLCRQACRDLAMAERGETIPTHDLLALTKGGQQVWLNISHMVVPLTRSDRFALVHIFRDISRKKETEQFVQGLLSSLTKLSESGRSDPSQRPSADPVKLLTPRELQVLRLLAEGFGTKAIAGKLLISPSTVGNHIQSLLSKLRVHSRLEAVALAFRLRLL